MTRRTLRRESPLRREPIVPTASCPPGWSWLFAGIFIGMLVSFLFYLREIAPNIPLATNPESTPTKVAAVAPVEKPEVTAKKSPHSLVRTPTEVAPLDPAEPQPEPQRPPFEFYEALVNAKSAPLPPEPTKAVLSENEPLDEVFPEETTLLAPTPIKVAGTYVLQVGSFRDTNAAEGLKAHLALLGISSYIQHVTLNGSDAWHRVKVGPITDLDTLNQIRTQLATHHLSSNVMKWSERE